MVICVLCAYNDFEVQMPTTVDIGTLIERSAEIRNGRSRITGTGVTVMRMAGWSNLGLTPEEIVAKFDHLTLAQIHAALAYYHANREEINAEIADEEAAVEEFFPAAVKPA
jgi:uncharacterized protein (DUF433 family)